MGCTRQQLNAFFDDLLTPQRFKDYCPNGLQVEGKTDVRHLVSGVTASQALIEAARDRGADAILVHHGYFWHSEPPCITGMKAARVRALIQADINLFAYHLPLDCHPLHGNNAALGRLMGIEAPEALDPEDPGTPVFRGQLAESLTVQGLADRLSVALDRSPLVIGEGDVTSVAWCTGAGQGYIDLAADAGADVYVTGRSLSRLRMWRWSAVLLLSARATTPLSATVCRRSAHSQPKRWVEPRVHRYR